MQNEKYDIVVCGGGMAGLSLVYRALQEGIWAEKRILILDKDAKDQNDRTWCFWQRQEIKSDFEAIVYRQWKELLFFSNGGEKIKLDTGPYVYKMIRSIDFYKHILAYIRGFDRVHFITGEVLSVDSFENEAVVITAASTYKAQYVFNSIYRQPELKPGQQYFLQHFKGVTIQTEGFHSDPSAMHFMDFRTSQEHGTTFFYTLPLSQTEIFTEYTVFSKALLRPEDYDTEIRRYIAEQLKIEDYKITEEEFGAIPMTDFPFQRRKGAVIQIGSAGGDTRASTGYTFLNTQKTISKVLESFRNNHHPFFETEHISRKHKLLDATILNVLDKNGYPGNEIFTDLFRRTAATTIFRFLDGESSALDDLQVMSSLKAKYFIGPFLKLLVKA